MASGIQLIKGFPFNPATKPDGSLGPVMEGHWVQEAIKQKNAGKIEPTFIEITDK